MSELSKGEILKRAQSENKGADLVELEAVRKDSTITGAIALTLGAILCAIEIVVGMGMNYALFLVLEVTNASLSIRRAIRNPVRVNVTTAVLYCIASALFLFVWVISLIKF